jgi:tetratricopeptide (TPR) repeat protein/predicted Ser/Thr protein kinase
MISPGDKVKHYEILRLIGKGGMGEVYLARDTALDREVALKFLPEEMKEDAKARERFIREAKSAAALDHPFICKIYETGEIDHNAFIVMEYVEGKNLREKLKEGAIPLKDTFRITLEIVEALETAHGKGIVHRDLKPDNIMLTPQGHVKVMDFGLAKRVPPAGDSLTKTLTQASVTEQGTLVGTLAYMSPEQAKGDMVDSRSDIFSLGVMFQEMISGKHPFLRPSPVETLTAILRDAPPSVHEKLKKVTPAVDHILKKSLAKDSNERYQTAAELALDIRNIQIEAGLGKRLLFRGWPLIVSGVALVLVLLMGIWWFFIRSPVSKPVAVPAPVSILIADFQNKTGDSVFEGGLEQALSIGLEDASFIDVYRRPRARKLADQLDPSAKGRLDSRLAQLVSRSEGINVVIDGSIEPSGQGYMIKVNAWDSVNSKKLAEVSKKVGSKLEVLNAASKLAAEVQSKLGGTPADSARVLSGETFTATSLEAMNAYARAQELSHQGKQDEAIKEYLRAINLDPNLGRAYGGLAVIYHSRGEQKKAEEYHAKALSLIDRMSEREKYRTRAVWYLLTRNYQKATEECSALVREFPADSAGNSNLALAYFYARDMSHAVEAGRRAVELYPKNITPNYNLAWYSIGAADFDTAEKAAQKVLELNPEYEKAFVCLALSELALGRASRAIEFYQQLKTISPYGESLAIIGLADLALFEGRQAEAKTLLEKGILADLENGRTELTADKLIMLAQTCLLQGQKSQASSAADRVVKMSKKEGLLLTAAQVYLEAGQKEKARGLAVELNQRLEPEPRAYAKLVEGEIRMAAGDHSGGISLFQEAQKLVDTWLGRFALARAYLEAKAFTEAHSEFETCLKRRGEAASIFFDDSPSYHYFPPVYYYLGRAQEGIKSPAASESYKTFLTIKEKDEGDPLVKDARRRIASL